MFNQSKVHFKPIWYNCLGCNGLYIFKGQSLETENLMDNT